MRALLTMGLVATLAAGAALAQAPPGAAPAPAVPTVVKVGDMAPDFSLQGTDGKTHKLSEYRGKQAVVIAWFPKAFTQGCTIECKSLAENGDKIKQYDVTYFMASTDNIEDNTKFAKATSVTLQGRGGGAPTVVEKKEADFPMLADPTKEVATKYGVLMANGQVANRWTFYIDKTGKVVAIDTAVRPATSAEDMIAKLAELKIAKKG
jgi:peroxiredoxin Q/BCP